MIMRKDENLIQKQPAEIYNRKGVPKNLGKFTGNHLCQGLFLSKVTDLNLHLYLKNRPWPKCFPPHFANFLRVSSFTEHPLHKKWSFPLRISSVNVTKSEGSFSTLIRTGSTKSRKCRFLCVQIFNFYSGLVRLTYQFNFCSSFFTLRSLFSFVLVELLLVSDPILMWRILRRLVTKQRNSSFFRKTKSEPDDGWENKIVV